MRRLLWVVALLSVSCGSARLEPTTPTPTGAPTPTVAPTASASPAPLRFPTLAEVPLEPGRYSSQPPFDIGFTFEVPAAGWESGHLHGEFFDILQLESPGSPSRWIAFAHPDVIHGQTDAPAAGLTAQGAIDTLTTLDGLESGPGRPFEIGGLTGVAADFRAMGLDVALFGGPNGDFALNDQLALRLAAVPFEDALLLVLVMAPEDEMEQALSEAAPILESVDFAAL